jgi:hypothetical protein
MNCYGNLTGHAADKDGKKKVAQELSTEVNSLMNTLNTRGSMNGQIGECKLISRRQYHISGKRRFLINIHMTMKLFSRNSER